MINDILLRHKTLTETNQDLVRDIEENQKALESFQETFGRLLKVRSSEFSK
jgi:hypothetical protein